MTPTEKDFSQPKDVTDFDLAFGPRNIKDYLPDWDTIPKEFQYGHTPYNKFISNWFFKGISKDTVIKPKNEIDLGRALAHIGTILRSWEPKHEHKEAGCAYLASLWLKVAP